MNPRSKAIGILGGMGPYATLAFFQNLLRLTPATKDWDHLRVVIDNNPQIPSRSRHYLLGEESPVAGMIDSCRRLQAYPVELIAIPCNSACYYLPAVQLEIAIPIVNIIEVSVEALVRDYPSASTVGVLGGAITYGAKTYQPFLAGHRVGYLHHQPETQTEIEQVIEEIKRVGDGAAAERICADLIQRYRRAHEVDAIILGCTELCGSGVRRAEFPIVDSSLELAKFLVSWAR